jgi:cutinase
VSTITPLTVRLSTLTVRVALAAFLGAVTAVAILAGGFALPAGIIGPMPPTIAPHVAAVALFGTPIPGF